MKLPVLEDLGDVRGKKVLVRTDFNVPMDGNTITDDFRIRAALPTINWLTERGAHVVCASHLGRPKGAPEPKYSMAPVRERLAERPGRRPYVCGSGLPHGHGQLEQVERHGNRVPTFERDRRGPARLASRHPSARSSTVSTKARRSREAARPASASSATFRTATPRKTPSWTASTPVRISATAI